MKSKFLKSFILLILVVAIISAMLVSANANTGTAVFGNITATIPDNGTNSSATDYLSESGTASQGTTYYFTDSYSSTIGYTATTVLGGSTTFSETSTETDLTIPELFDLLEESLDSDIAETKENGGNVEAISKVAAEIQQEISEMEQGLALKLHNFPDFINSSYEREGIAPSDQTQKIIRAINPNSTVWTVVRSHLILQRAIPVGESIWGYVALYSPNGFPVGIKLNENCFEISGTGKAVLSDFETDWYESNATNISGRFKLTGTYPGEVRVSLKFGCLQDNNCIPNTNSLYSYVDIKLFNTEGEKAHERMSEPEYFFTVLIAPFWYIFNSIKNLFVH